MPKKEDERVEAMDEVNCSGGVRVCVYLEPRATTTIRTHPMEIVMKMITINGNLSENTLCLRHVEKEMFSQDF